MTSRRAFITTALAAGAAGMSVLQAATRAQIGRWRAGEHYALVANPQPTQVAPGKVEVLEVFWYGCGHCFALDPVLEEWKTRKAAYVEFVRVPVLWGASYWQHAKLFYTLQALGRSDLHPQVFQTIHREGQTLADRDEVKARSLHYGFVSSYGVTAEQFDAAFDSMPVARNLMRAEELTRAYNVANVPVIFINGKYSSGVSEAGGAAQLMTLIDDLAASETQR